MKHYDNYRALWQDLLPRYDHREAKAIARTLLEERYGLTLTDIVCGGIAQLSAQQQDDLAQMMARLTMGEPIQYALGSAPFCGRSFHVAPGVLIPRPETEQLVHMTIEATRQYSTPSVLDIGTGSGCIAITTALEAPEATVSAWDISPDALQIARNNAAALHAKVCFREQDALHAPAEDTALWDVVVSNPPYVMQKERATMADHVLLHEPGTALFVPDDDPLCFYRAIAQYGRHALRAGGTLLFEINPLLTGEMLQLLEAEGYVQNRLIEDDFGKKRFTQSIISAQ